MNIDVSNHSSEQLCFSDSEFREIIHDLRGPLINLQGFTDELCSVVDNLMVLMNENSSHLPPEIQERLAEVIRDDVIPSSGFLRTAAHQLDQRLDKFAAKGFE